MPIIRAMTAADVPAGLELCRFAGWNQLTRDWERMLEVCSEGLFVAEENGRICASASAIAYGTTSGWIGMILVHPDFRRRGIATLLMNQCIDSLRRRGVRCIKLDATDQGRPVYLKLGFVDERPIIRVSAKAPLDGPVERTLRTIVEDDWPAITELDRRAFGADRLALLRSFAGDGLSAVIEKAGRIVAYGFARPGYEAALLGPIVAAETGAGLQVIKSLLAGLPPGRVFWDLLPENLAAAAVAKELGFAVERSLTRMYLGDGPAGGDASLVFSAAGFEWG